MERFYLIAPALIPAAYLLTAFGYFCILAALGKQPEVAGLERRKFTDIFGPFLTTYFIWLIRPVERMFVAARVPPNAITAISIVCCATSGLALATGHLSVAAWVYILAGAMDILDGRLARATNRVSQAGAFLDSVSDRWGELLVFAGCMWFLRESAWLGAVMLAVSGSMMVSYTRARGEGLGMKLDGGTMARPERIATVAVGIMVAAWLEASSSTAGYAIHVVGGALLLTGSGATVTSLGRWRDGYRILREREQIAARVVEIEGARSAMQAELPDLRSRGEVAREATAGGHVVIAATTSAEHRASARDAASIG